jgi:hypothetical protein
MWLCLAIFSLLACEKTSSQSSEDPAVFTGSPSSVSSATPSVTGSLATPAPSLLPSSSPSDATPPPVTSAAAPNAAAPSAAAPSAAAPSAAAPSAPGAVLKSWLDERGQLLPQTDARPVAEGEQFLARIERLVAAIRADDPTLAEAAFFPKLAYEQVKAIPQPGKDYEQRLLGAFARDIHALHVKLGPAAKSLRLVGVDVPAAKVQWMAKGKEGNRIGYYRVVSSQLRLATDHALAPIRIASMISWRGEWFVVHLSSFK